MVKRFKGLSYDVQRCCKWKQRPFRKHKIHAAQQQCNNMMPLGLTFLSFKEARGGKGANEREKVILKQISGRYT